MAAFYASVEERDRPELVGKPTNRGVVSAANYVDQRYDMYHAMASDTTHRFCPHGIYLPPWIRYYAEVSEISRTKRSCLIFSAPCLTSAGASLSKGSSGRPDNGKSP